MSATASESWGVGTFDNMAAQDFAYEVSLESPRFEVVLNSLDDSIAGSQQVLALGELLNGADGHLEALDRAPLLAEWLEGHTDFSPGEDLRAEIVERIEQIARKSELQRYWTSKRKKGPWTRGVAVCLERLKNPRNGKRRGKVKWLSKRSFSQLASKRFRNRPEGFLVGDKLVVGFTDPATAVEMTRYRGLTRMEFSVDTNKFDQDMQIPTTLLLRGWWPTLHALYALIGGHQAICDLFLDCTRELAHLPNLQRFDATCFRIDDSVIKAVASNPSIEVISLALAVGPTDKCLKDIAKCRRLKELRFYGCPKVREAKVWAYEEDHPKVRVSYTPGPVG